MSTSHLFAGSCAESRILIFDHCLQLRANSFALHLHNALREAESCERFLILSIIGYGFPLCSRRKLTPRLNLVSKINPQSFPNCTRVTLEVGFVNQLYVRAGVFLVQVVNRLSVPICLQLPYFCSQTLIVTPTRG